MKRILYILLTVWSLQIAYAFSANAQSETGFKVRAFHLDFRTQVMTSSAIKELANDLANKGINTLILEYEASFPFTQNATLSNEYAFTKDEIKDIVSHCQSIGIDVIPLQNCFGWAKHPAPYPPCGGRFPSTRPQTVLTCLHVYGFPLVTLLFTIVLNH